MQSHKMENRIFYHDTDSGGVVYYARYLEHMEEGRSEYCRTRGIDLSIFGKKGVLFPVVHLEIDYKASALYGDVISIVTTCEKIGHASVRFVQEIKRGDTLLVKGATVWACVNSQMRPQPVPDEIRKALLAEK